MSEPQSPPAEPHRERRARPEPAPVVYAAEPGVEPGGPVRVVTSGYALHAPRDAALRVLRIDHIAARLAAKDPTLWGHEAESEAAIRLGWLDLPSSSRELLPRLATLRDELAGEGIDRVVLCGMGGSSLAPEVICASAGRPLVVLDSTDPGQVRAAMVELERTVVVVSSKSGSTVETDSQRRLLAQAFASAGIAAAGRLVAVTDPGSALADLAASEGWRAVFLADANVGGRYSALSAFGLVPSALAGVDVAPLLADAAATLPDLARDHGNPGLDLGAAIGGCAAAGRDKLVLVDEGSGLVGFADWAEQLVAESTGKNGTGVLPVVVEGPAAPGTTKTKADDLHVVHVTGAGATADLKTGTVASGPLGAQLLVWEYATAVAGRILRINPFDQPDVESAKTSTRALLEDDGPLDAGAAAFTDGDVEGHGDVGSATSLGALIEELLAGVPATGYLAVHAYLDRLADSAAAQLRPALAARLPRPVTFGWGPRFLHSTGQLHKGGAPVGVFLQVTGAVGGDLDVPGRPFGLARLQLAQALGDARVLRERGRPVVRLHLLDRTRGLQQLSAAVCAPVTE
jgi:glucose-6-phosphate isomerase